MVSFRWGESERVRRVAGDSDDLEAGVLQDSDDAFASQRLVLADNDPERVLARHVANATTREETRWFPLRPGTIKEPSLGLLQT